MPQETQDLTPSFDGAHGVPEIVTPVSARALFWRPRYLRSSDALHHLPFLFWLIDLARPQVMAEIGVDDGVSYFAACQAMDKLSEDIRCHGITAQDLPDDVLAYNGEQYAEFSRLGPGDARKLAGQMDDGSVDLLCVRGAPDQALISALTDDWPRRMSAQGVILIFGVSDWPEDGPERHYLEKTALQYPVISFEDGAGLVAVLSGPNQPGRLRDLAALEANAPGSSEVRHVFRRLGSAVEHEWAARDGAEKAEAALMRAEDAEAALSTAEARQAEQDAHLEKLRRAHTEQEQQVAVLQAKLESQSGQESADLGEVLREHGAAKTELGTLRARLEDAEAKAQSNSQEQDEARAALAAAEAALAEAEQRAADRIAAKDRALQKINAQLRASRGLGSGPTDIRALTVQLEAGRNERDEVNRDLQALKLTHAALESEVETLRAERDDAQAFADALKSSTSWKLTAPVRRIIDGLRRLRGRP